MNTIEAIQNQSQGETSATKSAVFSVMKEAIEEGNKNLKIELNKEMKVLKDDIVNEAHIYADNINDKIKQQMVDIQTTLALALTGMQQLTGVVNPTRSARARRRAVASPAPPAWPAVSSRASPAVGSP